MIFWIIILFLGVILFAIIAKKILTSKVMLKNNPKRAAGYYNNLGVSYIKIKSLDLAISNFNKAIELDPNLVVSYDNRANAYFLKKEYDKAWADVHKAQELGQEVNPDFIEQLTKASGREK